MKKRSAIWISFLLIVSLLFPGCSGLQLGQQPPAPANVSCKDVVEKCDALVNALKEENRVCKRQVTECEEARSNDRPFLLSPEVTAIGGFILGVLTSIGIWKATK